MAIAALSPQDLRRRAQTWKRRLNLMAWTIRMKFVPYEDLPVNHATVDFRADHDIATITMRQNESHAEYWLVHELLHLVLAGLRPEEEGFNLIEEVAINRLARAYCRPYQIPIPSEQDL